MSDMRLKRYTRIALLLVLPVPILLLAQTTRPTVAVLDFDARGISSFEAASLTDRLSTELGNTEAVILIERKQLDQIMEEQGLQQSGCVTAECVAQVGQLLGVQFMVSGSVNKLGSTYTVEAKMFSIETGENVQTVSKTHKGQIDELIPLMEAVAWELVGLDKRRLETVAVLDFEGRGISQLEAGTLSDRFTSSMSKTGAVLIVARQEVNEILDAQGFVSADGSCTSAECAAEVGAMLGVKNIINGSVGRVGQTYTVDIQMVSVATGATVKSVSKTYRGEVDGLITEVELLAWAIVDMDPPSELFSQTNVGPSQYRAPKVKTKGKALIRSLIIPGTGQIYSGKSLWGLTWMATEAALGAMAYSSYSDFTAERDNYNNYQALYNGETNTTLIAQYKEQVRQSRANMDERKSQMIMYGGLAGAVWLVNGIHAYLAGSAGMLCSSAAPFSPASNSYTPQTPLTWGISLV